MGGLSVALLRGDPKACPQSTQLAQSSAVPSLSPPKSPSASGSETVEGVQVEETPAPTVVGSGGNVAQVGLVNFTIAGGAGKLVLGISTPVRLTLTNPNGVQIFVTALTVGIASDSTPPGCSSASNVRLTQSNVSADHPITLPARGSVTLTSAPSAPQVTLLNLPAVNQDACKGKSFALTYRGSAHS
jgi:hypothetical protein